MMMMSHSVRYLGIICHTYYYSTNTHILFVVSMRNRHYYTWDEIETKTELNSNREAKRNWKTLCFPLICIKEESQRKSSNN